MALQKVGERALQASASNVDSNFAKNSTKTVLEEDKYVEDLEKIIVRDFYPDLPKLQLQQEYFNAVEANNTEKLREIHIKCAAKRRNTTGRTPNIYSTPSTFETPIGRCKQTPVPESNPSNVHRTSEDTKEEPAHNPEEPAKNKKDPSDVSLDNYLRKHTSEDNESFSEIMKEAERKHMAKHAWLYEQQQEKSEDLQERLALPSIEQQAIESGNSTRLQTWKYTPKNAVMYAPQGVELSEKEKIELQGKQPKKIEHQHTRFVGVPFSNRQGAETIAEAANTKAALLHGKVGVDGKELLPSSTPKVNGFGFVATPSPAPGVEDSPMMTWGEIEGTPFQLDGGSTPLLRATPGPQFKIPDVPKREHLGLKLAEKASKAHRDKKQQAISRVRSNFASPSPKFGGTASKTDRLGYLSPAAQRLASSKLGIRMGTDKALRASYTPSPSRRTRGEKTPLSLTTPSPGTSASSSRSTSSRRSERKTPGTSIRKTPRTESKRDTEEASMTDNLLNFPKRQKAADFF